MGARKGILNAFGDCTSDYKRFVAIGHILHILDDGCQIIVIRAWLLDIIKEEGRGMKVGLLVDDCKIELISK